MSENTTPPETPEPPPGVESTDTPPIVHEPVAQVVTAPATGKEVEVTRIPEPVMTGGRVVFPNAYGVDYTVDEKVVNGAQPLKGALKVKAVARPGFRFAKGLKQTFNLKG